MKIMSWNVNGLRSSIENGFIDIIKDRSADIICIQETKVANKMKDFKIDGYYQYFNYSKKSGYSGVAILSKEKAEKVIEGIELENEYGELENIDYESRVLTLEYNDFFIVSVYVPCSQKNSNRIIYRAEFDSNLLEYIENLNNIKNVIVCGDFNVCHKKIDICNWNKHKNIELFSDEERGNFNELLNIGLIDTYRYMHPQMRQFTFWTNDIEDRTKSEFGWRLDYILVSDYLKKEIREANVLTEIKGSDHCPIELVIKI